MVRWPIYSTELLQLPFNKNLNIPQTFPEKKNEKSAFNEGIVTGPDLGLHTKLSK